MYKYLPLLLVCASCMPTPKTTTQKMQGEWESYSILIKIVSPHSVKGDSVINIPTPEIYERTTDQRPIRTNYNADGTYQSIYRMGKNDSIFYTPNGKWQMEHDTVLALYQIEPKPDTMRYFIRFLKDGAEFRRFDYDYDHDGSKDDAFYGLQRKLK